MTARGKYVRTPEIRERNRRNAFRGTQPCPWDCTCGKHTNRSGGRKPCPPNCTCGNHYRTEEHNRRIGASVAAERWRKRVNGQEHR